MTRTQGIIGTIGLAGALFLFAGTGGSISGDEAKALVRDGALLLDVRTPEEFAAGHVGGAVNIPVQQLEAALGTFPAREDQDIVVYCQSGRRSANAAGILQRAGYSKVHDLGPRSNWKP